MECDYDQSPTPLYKLIEQQDWATLLERLEEEEEDDEEDDDDIIDHDDNHNHNQWTSGPWSRLSRQARVWIVKKEASGRLRWRMLPLHAALTFRNAPFAVVEGLLEAYPPAASAKDDQGMLPLHLALRNFGSPAAGAGSNSSSSSSSTGILGKLATTTAPAKPKATTKNSASTKDNSAEQWQILEELLTVFPAAVFSKDRKGRTPLQGGLLAAASDADSNSSNNGNKTALTVLQLWTTIQTAGETNTVTQQQQQAAEHQLAQLQKQHLSTLEDLRAIFWKQQAEQQRQFADREAEWRRQLDESAARERRWREEAAAAAAALAQQQENETQPSQQQQQQQQQTQQQLQSLLQEVLDQQQSRWRQVAVQQEQQLEQFRQAMGRIVVNSDNDDDNESSRGETSHKPSSPSALHQSQRSLADQILEDLGSSQSGVGSDSG